MSILLLVVAVVVIGVLAAIVTGRLDASLPAAVPSSPHRPLPQGRLEAADVEGVRFSLAVRGYRMDEVDAVLARLHSELAERDAQLQKVTSAPVSAAPVMAAPVMAAAPHLLPAPLRGSLDEPLEVTPPQGLSTGEIADVGRRHGRRARSSIDGA